ncbi:hypothetical protein IPJ63_02390 [Candidatus Nomurabacteria bacterium]|nr:MAG: hypothetical protein IPJ63_02390 [Candidatus Nomurabacteria bacterium]
MKFDRKIVSFEEKKDYPDDKERMVSGIVLEADKQEQMMQFLETYDGRTVSQFVYFVEAMSHVGEFQIDNKKMVMAKTFDGNTVSYLDPTQAVLCGEATDQASYEYMYDKFWNLKMVNSFGSIKREATSRKDEIRRIWSLWDPKFKELENEVSEEKIKLQDEMEGNARREGVLKLQEYKKRTNEVLEKERKDRIADIYKKAHEQIIQYTNDLLLDLKNIPENLPWED